MKSRFPKKTDQDVLKYLNSTKSERLEMIKQFKNLLPDNYAKNDIKEDLVLEYVEQFRQQYVHLFSTRPPLMLFPKNELGCKVGVIEVLITLKNRNLLAHLSDQQSYLIMLCMMLKNAQNLYFILYSMNH